MGLGAMKLPLVAALGCLSILVLLPASARPQTDDSRSSFNRGVELQQKGDLAGARLAYEEALKLSPRRVDALSNLGLVYLNLENNEKAIECFDQALFIKPELLPVRMFLGLAYYRANQFEAAHREVAKVVEAQPHHPQALHLWGLCLLKLDKIQPGISALEAALQVNPNNTDAAYTLATAYVGNEEIEKAEALLEGPLRSNNSAEVHLVRGSILNANRNPQVAIQELIKAKQLNEKLPTLRTQLGYAYLLLGDHEQAIREFLVALAQNPDDFHANAYLGWLYLNEKRYQEATEKLTAALRQKPDNSGILYQLGQIHHASGQIENAAALLERVVKQQPNFVPAHVLLARVYMKLKRPADFAREQAIIRQLSEKEQERNLGSQESYGDREAPLPKFSEGPSSKPNPRGRVKK
jgi:tetratricopeptide (TPR) repeat protein